MTMIWLSVMLSFGAVCSRYVSVVGFLCAALLMIAFSALVSKLSSAPMGLLDLLFGYLALQIGYFGALLLSSLARHVALLRANTRYASRKPIDLDLGGEKTKE